MNALKTSLYIAFTSGVMFVCHPVFAASVTWNNSGTTWGAAGSWNGGLPTAANNVFFTNAQLTNPNLTSSGTALNLSIGVGGYTISSSGTGIALTIANNTGNAINASNTSGVTTISAPIIISGTANLLSIFLQSAGGTLNLSGVISSSNAIAGIDLGGAGTYSLSGSNTYAGNTSVINLTQLNINNSKALSSGTLQLVGAASVSSIIDNTSGAAISVANALNLSVSSAITGGVGTGNRQLTFVGSNNLTFTGSTTLIGGSLSNTFSTTSGTLTLNGGVTQTSGSASLIKSGVGTLVLGGTLGYLGTTTISAGTLLINGDASTSTGAVLVTGSGAKLGGAGTIGGATTISGSSYLGVADGLTGITTFSSTSGTALNLNSVTAGKLLFELNGSGTNDQIKLTGGALSISGLTFSDFNFITLSGFNASAPSTYTLFSGNTAIIGSLGTATGTIGADSASLSISGNDIVLSVIPEPAPYAMVLGGLGLLVIYRRSRRQRS